MLSLKTAQFNAVYDKVRSDPWIAAHRGETEQIFLHLTEVYQLSTEQAETVAKMLAREQGTEAAPMSLKEAQAKEITIPPTADQPVAKKVLVPEQVSQPPAAPSDKVIVEPKTPEGKEETVNKALEDQQATRQEQLQNSLKALEVVLHDFVQAMYGLDLNHEYTGKLIESIIDKASDLSAQQTADTVKQLASPFIGQ